MFGKVGRTGRKVGEGLYKVLRVLAMIVYFFIGGMIPGIRTGHKNYNK